MFLIFNILNYNDFTKEFKYVDDLYNQNQIYTIKTFLSTFQMVQFFLYLNNYLQMLI